MSARARPLEFRDRAPDAERLREEVLEGLQRPQKSIPCKFLYDVRGSELFERICELEEYYLTRTELGIMEAHAGEMAALLGPGCTLIEYGSGSSLKTRLLLDHLEAPAAYVPIDISRTALASSTHALALAYPSLEILPMCADYTDPIEIPRGRSPSGRRAVYFPGSTIGNFSPGEALAFLQRAATLVGGHGGLLIGVDLKKDPRTLERAYNDREGVTAAFNRNLLIRINQELGADFRVERFRHRAFYNRELSRIEMHLASELRQTVRLGSAVIGFEPGETIHTENSYKYGLDEFAALAAAARLEVGQVWTDRDRLFSVHYLTVS